MIAPRATAPTIIALLPDLDYKLQRDYLYQLWITDALSLIFKLSPSYRDQLLSMENSVQGTAPETDPDVILQGLLDRGTINFGEVAD